MPALSQYEAERIAQTREVCDVIEANAEQLKQNPHVSYSGRGNSYYYDYDGDGNAENAIVAKEWMANDLRVLRRDPRVVKTDKDYQNDLFSITLTLTTGAKIVLESSRKAVCTPTVIGQETKQERDYDNAPMITKTVDVIQWDCSPLLDV